MEEEKGEHVQKMKSTLLFCVCFRNPLAQMEDEEYLIVVCVSGTLLARWKMKSTLLFCVGFQEPSCPDGGGEARACSEDEEYFIVVCDFRNPLAQMEEEKGEHVQKMKSTLLLCVISGTLLRRWRRRRESMFRK